MANPTPETKAHAGTCTCPACAPALWAAGIKGVNGEPMKQQGSFTSKNRSLLIDQLRLASAGYGITTRLLIDAADEIERLTRIAAEVEMMAITLEARDKEIERLTRELSEVRKYSVERGNLLEAIMHQGAEIQRLRAALGELHAMVWGECPSILNEDSGGDGRLDTEIRNLIAERSQSPSETKDRQSPDPQLTDEQNAVMDRDMMRAIAGETSPKPTDSELYGASELFRHVWFCPMGWVGDKLIYGPGYTSADMKQWLIGLRRLVGFNTPEGVPLESPSKAGENHGSG